MRSSNKQSDFQCHLDPKKSQCWYKTDTEAAEGGISKSGACRGREEMMMQMCSLSLFERKFGNKAEIITFVLVLFSSFSLETKKGVPVLLETHTVTHPISEGVVIYILIHGMPFLVPIQE